MTEVSHLELAADTELRASGAASLVAWDPNHKLSVSIAASQRGARVTQLVIDGVIARRAAS